VGAVTMMEAAHGAMPSPHRNPPKTEFPLPEGAAIGTRSRIYKGPTAKGRASLHPENAAAGWFGNAALAPTTMYFDQACRDDTRICRAPILSS